MVKIILKNVLRSFMCGVIAAVVTGVGSLLLLFLMSLIVGGMAGFGAGGSVLTIVGNVFYVLMLIVGVVAAFITTGVFSNMAHKAAQNDDDGYKGKLYPTTAGLNAVPCVPLIFSLLLLPVLILCIVSVFVPSVMAKFAAVCSGISADLFTQIVLVGSGMFAAFIGTLFGYYIVMVKKYRAEVLCSACKRAFSARQYDESVGYSNFTESETVKERKKVATLESNGNEVNVYQDVLTTKHRHGETKSWTLFCKCALCGAKSEKYRYRRHYND